MKHLTLREVLSMRIESLVKMRVLSLLFSLLMLCLGSPWATAAPKLRFQTDVKGDLVLVGNTLGQECRASDTLGMQTPQPVVGKVGNCGDAATIEDSSSDVLWRADDTTANADLSTTIGDARSTAMLSLPPSSQVLYARLYWGGNLGEDPDLAKSAIAFEKVGAQGFSMSVLPNPTTDVHASVGGGGGQVYQASYDITAVLQRYGSGAYRCGKVVRRNVVNRDEDVQFNAWSMVVVYRNDKEPVRNITIYDGLDSVDLGRSVNLGVIGFRVPEGGNPQGRLGLIGYEGDTDKRDSFLFNGKPVGDAQNNPDNVFNSTRSFGGSPVSITGDLPQLTGTAGSMSGLDLDQIDISSMLKANDTQASLQANSVDDVYFVGGIFTSIRSRKPVIETRLLADPSSVRPGDTVTFTSTTKNIGDDDGTDLVIRHPLPDGLVYVPGSLVFVSGPEPSQNGKKTDTIGDDQAEIAQDPVTGKPVLVIRIGKGANGTTGGRLSPMDTPVVVQYKLKTDPNTTAKQIPTQSGTTATTAGNPNLPPVTFPSGNGEQPGAPTVVFLPNAQADLRVVVTKTPPFPDPNTPVNYGVDVKNVGGTGDPGPIHVTFKVPPGGVIDQVTPGPGWSCTQQERTVYCTRYEPLPAGAETHAVDVVVRNPNPVAADSQVEAQAGSDGALDPNPADNYWSEYGANRRIAGGGIGCSVRGENSSAGSGALVALLLCLVALLVPRSARRIGKRS
jgi:uncharacterized repeat protein (TIGR01451 family)